MNLIKARQQAHLPQNSFHEWTLECGKRWASFYRLENKYLIRFFNLADFFLTKDGEGVTAYPVPSTPNQTLEHLYLNLVMPLALSCQLKLVLHGSAVELGESAVVFLGSSGSGKSTLAASFSTSGYRFLTDDGLLLDKIKSQYFVKPNHPSIRLWDDSHDKLTPNSTRSAPTIDFSPKVRILANEQVRHCNESRLLKHVYFLGEGNTDKVSITKISGLEAIIGLQKHSFLLDMEERKMLTHHFQKITAVAKQPIFFQLDYPRRYEILPSVLKSVVKHTQEGILPKTSNQG